MEVLNAARLTPVSVQKHPSCIPERRLESKKLFPHKSLLSASKTIGGSLALISSVLGVESAKSLTYEEALGLSGVSSGASADVPDIDIGGIFNGIVSFATENPLLLGGGAVALVVPLVLSQVFKSSPKAWGVVSARSAFAKLSEEAGSVLLDIRDAKDFKEVGSPNLKTIKKKAVTITYADDNPNFLKKLALKFKDPENTTLYILDKFDGKSEFVAELATANSFKAAFAIKDGAEGPRGWLKSELPWASPSKGFNLGGLKEAIGSAFGESGDGLPATVGLAAAAGLGLLAFSEIETVLQLLGSAAIVQFTTKKLLYAKDRKVTLQQLDEFLNTKVAPQELVDEIKTIGKALLPASTTPPASLTAAVEPTTEAGPAPAIEEKVEPVPEVPVVVNAVVDPPKEVNDVPVAEVKAQSAPAIPRPLSPYPYYPDFKPPSSPSPSRP